MPLNQCEFWQLYGAHGNHYFGFAGEFLVLRGLGFFRFSFITVRQLREIEEIDLKIAAGLDRTQKLETYTGPAFRAAGKGVALDQAHFRRKAMLAMDNAINACCHYRVTRMEDNAPNQTSGFLRLRCRGQNKP